MDAGRRRVAHGGGRRPGGGPLNILSTAVLLAACVLSAAPARANGVDCGGDARSTGVVVEHRPARRGPLVAGPDTLCADLSDDRPPVTIDLYGSGVLPDGGGLGPAPYERGGRRPGRSPAPPFP